MKERFGGAAAEAAALWLVLAALSLVVRPLLPLDETRYASVAWEMWRRGDWLVPHLNGQPYAEKPPLLFWAVALGWKAFGVREWWVRLAPSLFPLAALFVVRSLARVLWPDDPRATRLAPWILMGTGLWAVFATVTMFDGMLALFASTALYGVALAWRRRPGCGFAILGVSLGLGILTKGPVVFLPVLPVCLLAPWWSAGTRPVRPGRWFALSAGAVALGAAIALAWVVPAAVSGGAAYRETILWRQTAERVVSSFAHRRGWWWYLPLLPALLLPWSVWPPLWRALATLRRGAADPGTRFCVAWVVPAFLLFSSISGKQPQYLLSLFPGFALLAARALSVAGPRAGRAARIPFALLLSGAGVLLGAVLALAPRGDLPEWVERVPAWPLALVVLGGAILMALPVRSLRDETRVLAVSTAFALAVVYASVLPAASPAYDLAGLAGALRRAQHEGRPVANAATYQGQYDFLGRLSEPIEEIEPENVDSWCADNPRGVVVLYLRGRDVPAARGALYVQPYRGRAVLLVACAALPGPARPTSSSGGSAADPRPW